MPRFEHERVAVGLKEAIRFICKSSLTYSAELSIEGLLGITLDNDEVFLVNIKEVVQGIEIVDGFDNSINGEPAPKRFMTAKHKIGATAGFWHQPSPNKRLLNNDTILQTLESPTHKTSSDIIDSESELVVDLADTVSEQPVNGRHHSPSPALPDTDSTQLDSKVSSSAPQTADSRPCSPMPAALPVCPTNIPISSAATRDPSQTPPPQRSQKSIDVDNHWLPESTNNSNSNSSCSSTHSNGNHKTVLKADSSNSRVSTPLSDVPLNLSGSSSSRRKSSVPEKRRNVNDDIMTEIEDMLSDEDADCSAHEEDVIVVKPEPVDDIDSDSAALSPRCISASRSDTSRSSPLCPTSAYSSVPFLPYDAPVFPGPDGRFSVIAPKTPMDLNDVAMLNALQPFTLPGVHTPPNSSPKVILPYPEKGLQLPPLSTPLLRQTLSQHVNSVQQQMSPKHNQFNFHQHRDRQANVWKKDGVRCANCDTKTTTTWRRDESGQLVCNPCGLYYKLHKSSGGSSKLSSNSSGAGGMRDQRHGYQCTNCGTTVTTMWRRDDAGNPVCNACGLYYKLHKVNRPLSMVKNHIHARNRKPKASDNEPPDRGLSLSQSLPS